MTSGHRPGPPPGPGGRSTPGFYTPPSRPVAPAASAPRPRPAADNRLGENRVPSTRIRPYPVEPPRRSRSRVDPAVVIAALVMIALAGAVVVGLAIT
ncbi:hypothetical protein P9A14_19480 [Gordonia hongkongensis]|uniref:Serine/threonine protein kinase n=1 Tax=Gordonia hongkongensis TaxID=1701090 RepID=A0AAX3T5Q0_9ACTN|nr:MULTISPECIES: hypothetical protein [Gordonia]MDF6100921.1 hypothetical protein [Gordonia hongkongensis]UCZ92074.1 hypothetical protein LEL84_10730 [Gordonia sp. WA4-43]WFP24289.1 hypothetical protein P9A14_19480 [Gordonia hongkongensis]